MERAGNQGCSVPQLSWTAQGLVSSQERSHLGVSPGHPTTDTVSRCGKTQPSPLSVLVPGVIPGGCWHLHMSAHCDAPGLCSATRVPSSPPEHSVHPSVAQHRGVPWWGGPPWRARCCAGADGGACVAMSGGFPCGGGCCHGFAEPRRFHGGSAVLWVLPEVCSTPGCHRCRCRCTPAPECPSPCGPPSTPPLPPPGSQSPFPRVVFSSLHFFG